MSPKTQQPNQKNTPPGIFMLPIWSKANLMLFTLFTGCHDCCPIISRLQSATKSSWWTLVWPQHSLWMSGCPIMNLVWVPSTLGWYWGDFLPNCGQAGSTLPLNWAKRQGARRSCQWLSSSQMEWVRGSWGWWLSFATPTRQGWSPQSCFWPSFNEIHMSQPW